MIREVSLLYICPNYAGTIFSIFSGVHIAYLLLVVFPEQCSQLAKNKIPFSQGASPKVFFNLPWKNTCKLAISAREETEDGSLWSIVKSLFAIFFCQIPSHIFPNVRRCDT